MKWIFLVSFRMSNRIGSFVVDIVVIFS